MVSRLRPAKSYARRAPTKEPYDYVLIVCEGGKTEPQYFDALILAEGLSSANVHVISGDGHTDPVSIVKIAELNLANGYNRIFCVFDRNGHANYEEALARIANQEAGRNGTLKAIASWPCFEVWLLLHFAYSAKPFEKTGTRSSCDNVVRLLLEHIPDYAKGRATIYGELVDRLDLAIRHARRLAEDNINTKSTNPATSVFELVNYLKNLKK